MNNNTKRRKALFAKENKGNFPKPVFKKKAKPFPQPKDAGLSLANQRAMFYGAK